MRTVRLFFSKKGITRYISHLDMYRCFTRALQASHVPLWYTEGFNSHIYLSFALPLSLGIESDYEAVDIKLPDEYDFSHICENLNAFLPDYIRVFDAAFAQMKVNLIKYAQYVIEIQDEDKKLFEFCNAFREMLCQDELIVEKRSKKGSSLTDVKSLVNNFEIKLDGKNAEIGLILAAGSEQNLGPMLLLSEVAKRIGSEPEQYLIRRTSILTNNMEIFK